MTDIKAYKRVRNGTTYMTFKSPTAGYSELSEHVAKYFPNAKITSGGFGSLTVKLIPTQVENIWPTEVVAKAKYEIDIFERPSSDTSLELIAEVMMLRSLVRDMRTSINTIVMANMYSNRVADADELLALAKVIEESKVSVP